MKSHNQRKRSSLVVPLILFLFTSIPMSTTSLGHGQPQKRVTGTDLRQRIGALMRQTLDKREMIGPQGMSSWAPVPPGPEIVQEVQEYGDRAVPILAEYVASGSQHERELAMQFLSYIDSVRIVEPLLMVVQHDPEPILRKQGLRYITAQPWDVAEPILRHASEADRDPGVREYAKQTVEGQQARSLKSPSANFIRDRIARMVDYIVRRSEFALPDGVKVRTVPRPDNDEIEELRHYGDRAVPGLSQFLTSEDSSRKDLAMRLLGDIGTSGIIEPLEKVARTDPSPFEREQALRWLSGAPLELASPIIRQAAKDDPDPIVRRTAQELLDAQKPK